MTRRIVAAPCYRTLNDKTINISLYHYVREEIYFQFLANMARNVPDFRCKGFNDFIGNLLIEDIKYWVDYFPEESLVGQKIFYIKEPIQHAITGDSYSYHHAPEGSKVAIKCEYEERESVAGDTCKDVQIFAKLYKEFHDILCYLKSLSLIDYGCKEGTKKAIVNSTEDTGYYNVSSLGYFEYYPIKTLWATGLLERDLIEKESDKLINMLDTIDTSLQDIRRGINNIE
jgi:hypothetical protein